jgi:SAM-dependent methyltransferase
LNEETLYAPARDVKSLEECHFYHVTDLPGVGTVGEHWDLRRTIDAYLGQVDFQGRRVLDVGTASGFLSFEMERRGADVVSFDVPDGRLLNHVPYANPAFDEAGLLDSMAASSNRLKNSYWFAHRAFGSRARVHYGDIYALPESLGTFDVVVFGMVLPHLRDPFLALQSGARLSRDRVVVIQQSLPYDDAVMHFMPDPATCSDPRDWWYMSEGCMTRMLAVLGFTVERKTRAQHFCVARDRFEECTTFVARRTPR